MNEFWNSVRTFGGRARRDGGQPDDLVDASSVSAYCGDDERVEGVLTASELVRATDDWQTSEEPGPDCGVVVLVTDRQVVAVVGGSRDPDVTGDDVRRIDHAAIDEVTIEDSLLSTTLAITTGDGVRVAFEPDDDAGLSDVTRFLRRASLRWASLAAFREEFREKLVGIERALEAGDDGVANRRAQSVRNDLSELAQSSSIHEVDLPALEADLQAMRARLDEAVARGHWRRARSMLGTGDGALEACELRDAVDAFAEGGRAVGAIVDCGGDVVDAVDAEPAPSAVADGLLERLAACCRRAETDDPEVWITAVDGYEAIRDAAAAPGAPVRTAADAVAFELAWAAGRAVAACDAAAERLESRGQEAHEAGDDEAARGHYESALEALDVRDRIGDRTAGLSTLDGADERRERSREKIEATQWQWGGGQ